MATEILRPNAAGAECNITWESGADCPDHWQNVDEEIADGTTTKVYSKATAGERDLYDLPAHSEGSGTINFIKIYINCSQYFGPGTQRYAKPVLKSNSKVTEGTQISLTSSYVTYSQKWDTNPADSKAWEWSDIDALQIGVWLNGDATYNGRCSQVYVEVDYTPAVARRIFITHT